MPSAPLLLAFLVSGYFAVARYLVTRSIIRRASGHPQYFLAAAGGAVLFVLSVLIAHRFRILEAETHSLQWTIDVFLQYFSKSVTPERRTYLQVEAAVISAGLVWLLPALLNLPLRTNVSLTKAILARYGAVGPLEMVLDQCLRRTYPVMLTQSDGKVYVGYVLSTALEEGDWLRLQPVFSGFRDDHQKFVITTDYTWIDELESGKGRDESDNTPFREDFVVLIKLDTVTSVHPYDLRTNYKRNFEYVEAPLAAEVPPSTPPPAQAPMPGPTIVLPDWYTPPMAWKPPPVAEYERFEEGKRSDARYPRSLVSRAYRYVFRTPLQRHLYKAYAAAVLLLPAAMALGGWDWIIADLAVGVFSFAATARSPARL